MPGTHNIVRSQMSILYKQVRQNESGVSATSHGGTDAAGPSGRYRDIRKTQQNNNGPVVAPCHQPRCSICDRVDDSGKFRSISGEEFVVRKGGTYETTNYEPVSGRDSQGIHLGYKPVANYFKTMVVKDTTNAY